MIDVDNVWKLFGRVAALAGVCLEVSPGEMVLLLGPNGAGKSTLLRCILGVIDFEGRIRVDGLDPLTNGRAVRNRVGYMPQANGLYGELTVEETLRFYAALRGVPFEHGLALLRDARLDHVRGARVGELSGGMVQRLGFALCLLSDPPILLLDEPFASLDADSQERLLVRLQQLTEEGRTIVLSTHTRRRPLSMAHRAVTVSEGRVIGTEAGDLSGSLHGVEHP